MHYSFTAHDIVILCPVNDILNSLRTLVSILGKDLSAIQSISSTILYHLIFL